MGSKTPLAVLSDDPEVMALQAVIKGIHHMGARSLEPRQLKVLSVVEVCKKAFKIEPTLKQIAAHAGVEPADIATDVAVMVERRYLVEIENPFSKNTKYKTGPTGGVALHAILDRRRKKELVQTS